jgi:hypothetical protein
MKFIVRNGFDWRENSENSRPGSFFELDGIAPYSQNAVAAMLFSAGIKVFSLTFSWRAGFQFPASLNQL